MNRIEELYNKYGHTKVVDISPSDILDLQKILGEITPSDLQHGDNDLYSTHRMYLELLQRVRRFSAAGDTLKGKNFSKTVRDLLSVGQNGLYSNELRFVYELIQNADDCKYSDNTNCQLKFFFDFNGKDQFGRIIVTSNELGFEPRNVLGLTGIAEENKNVTTDIEIGEKGIGFKSIFGITDKVIVQSGYFSFLLKNIDTSVNYDSRSIWDEVVDFTVPIPFYENYSCIEGTRYTIYVEMNKCKELFQKIKQRYSDKESLIKENPILFLRKLSRLEISSSDNSSIIFDVDRKPFPNDANIQIEESVSISITKIDGTTGNKVVNSLECYRFTQTITYNAEECRSRYSNDINFDHKTHQLIALFPHNIDSLGVTGSLYSFLPTKVRISVPLMLHAPFKLDASREYVDNQNYNSWFNRTYIEINTFLKKVYVELAHRVKKSIVYYILAQKQDLFIKENNDKVACLCNNPQLKCNLFGEQFSNLKIFLSESDTFLESGSLIYFEEDLKDPARVHQLLSTGLQLFIPPTPVNMSRFGLKQIKDAYGMLFTRSLSHDEIFSESIDIINDDCPDFDYKKRITDYCSSNVLSLSKTMVGKIVSDKTLYRVFKDFAKGIRNGQIPLYSISSSQSVVSKKYIDMIDEDVSKSNLSSHFVNYWNKVKVNLSTIDSSSLGGLSDKGVFIAANNSLSLAMGFELESFAEAIRVIEGDKIFYVRMVMRQISEKLDHYDDYSGDDGDKRYYELVKTHRKTTFDVLGKERYDAFVKAIQEVGSDEYHFIDELIQNADDCRYEVPDPTFVIDLDGDILRTYTNEIGFSKQDLRAITAIGESSKTSILSDNQSTIGEKGLGFKSVFRIATSVEIRSGNFAFSLDEKTPTIPSDLDNDSSFDGTVMVLHLKKNVDSAVSLDHILKSCICLHRLNKVILNGTEITISRMDNDTRRIITFNGKQYSFTKYLKNYTINDVSVLKERPPNKNNKNQSVSILIPDDPNYFDEWHLYSGLPTSTVIDVPMIIDAPFELTSSRGDPLNSRWNSVISQGVLDSLQSFYNTKKSEGLSVLQYVSSNWKVSSEQHLNFNLIEFFYSLDFLPLIDGRRAKPKDKCFFLPDFILRLKDRIALSMFFNNIIDVSRSNPVVSKLRALNCYDEDVREGLIAIISKYATTLLNDVSFRNDFYEFVAIQDAVFKSRMIALPIFPVHSNQGTIFIPYDKEIYYYEGGDFPKEGYYVLDVDYLPADLANKILDATGNYINKLSQEVFDQKYRDKVLGMVKSSESPETIAEFLLKEYTNNFNWFVKCYNNLLQLFDQIPVRFEEGEYKIGPKYIHDSSIKLNGSLLKYFAVHPDYRPLAEYLGSKSLLEIQYQDFPTEWGNVKVEFEDMGDLIRNGFKNYDFIIQSFKDDGHIRLCDELSSDDIDEENIADIFRIEYDNDSNVVSEIIRLLDLKEVIPCKMLNGDTRCFPFYTCESPDYKGELLKGLTVSQKDGFVPLSRLLGSADISELSYSEDLVLENLDILDLKDLFSYLSKDSFKQFILSCSNDSKIEFINHIWDCSVSDEPVIANNTLKLFSQDISLISFIFDIISQYDDSFNDEIPAKMLNGKYRKGVKYLAPQDLHITGKIFDGLIADHEWDSMGSHCKWPSIEDLTFESIMHLIESGRIHPITSISDNDLHDLLDNHLFYAEEIVMRFYENKLITESQVTAFKLSYLKRPTLNPDYSEQPGVDFNNISSSSFIDKTEIHDELSSIMELSPNLMIDRLKSEKIPQSNNSLEVDRYLRQQYGHEEEYIHCQMCSVEYFVQYVYFIESRPSPKYSWKQSMICLCPMCSKKFEIGTNNIRLWNSFIENIEKANVSPTGLTSVPFNPAMKLNIYFTADHISALQEIIDLEKNDPFDQ